MYKFKMRMMTDWFLLVSFVKNFLDGLSVSISRVDDEAVQVEEHRMRMRIS